MAIRLLFDNLIIPIHILEDKYDGGFEQCCLDHLKVLKNETAWFDDYLFTICAMDYRELDTQIIKFNYRGLDCYTESGNTIHIWCDIYITDRLSLYNYREPDWICFQLHQDKLNVEFDVIKERNIYYTDIYQSAYLKGTKLGPKRKNDDNIFVSSKDVVSAEKPGKRMKEFFLRNKNSLF